MSEKSCLDCEFYYSKGTSYCEAHNIVVNLDKNQHLTFSKECPDYTLKVTQKSEKETNKFEKNLEMIAENNTSQKSCETCKYFKKWDDEEFPYCEHINLRLYTLTACSNFEEEDMNKFQKALQEITEEKDDLIQMIADDLYKLHNQRVSSEDLTPINKQKDPINPNHYTQGKIQCIDAIEAATVNKKGLEAFAVGNVIKYLWRYEEKGGIEDVKKCQWYLNRLLKVLENKDETD